MESNAGAEGRVGDDEETTSLLEVTESLTSLLDLFSSSSSTFYHTDRAIMRTNAVVGGSGGNVWVCPVTTQIRQTKLGARRIGPAEKDYEIDLEGRSSGGRWE